MSAREEGDQKPRKHRILSDKNLPDLKANLFQIPDEWGDGVSDTLDIDSHGNRGLEARCTLPWQGRLNSARLRIL